MTNEEEKYERIERYVDRLLSAEERSAFEAEMFRDPELRREVDAYIEAQELIVDQGVLNVKLKLQEIHQSEVAKVKGKKYYLAGAVLVMVSATLVYLLFTNTDPVQPEKNTTPATDTITGTTAQTIVSNKDQATTTQNNAGLKTTTTTNVQTPGLATTQNLPQTKTNTTDTTVASTTQKVVTPVTNNDSQKDSDPVKNDPPKADKIDCAAKPVTGSLTTRPSCSEEANGAVIVTLSSVKGGTKPYKYALEKEEEFKTSSQFTDLAPGIYKVLVKDKNDCVYELDKAEVKTKDCTPESAFNPNVEHWKIPAKQGFSGELRILNRANIKVYSVHLSNGYPESWNGTDNNGIALPAGVYLYMLISDNGDVTKNHVTIIQ